jgi:hypothetical protein
LVLPEGVGPARATLFVNEAGKQADGLEFASTSVSLARELIIAVDVRGIGETKPPHSQNGERRNEFTHLFDVETAMTYHTWYMDRSLFGMRVADVIRSVDYALSRDDVSNDGLHAVGQGAGALWCLRGRARSAHHQRGGGTGSRLQGAGAGGSVHKARASLFAMC